MGEIGHGGVEVVIHHFCLNLKIPRNTIHHQVSQHLTARMLWAQGPRSWFGYIHAPRVYEQHGTLEIANIGICATTQHKCDKLASVTLQATAGAPASHPNCNVEEVIAMLIACLGGYTGQCGLNGIKAMIVLGQVCQYQLSIEYRPLANW